jgi:hypothetical protein
VLSIGRGSSVFKTRVLVIASSAAIGSSRHAWYEYTHISLTHDISQHSSHKFRKSNKRHTSQYHCERRKRIEKFTKRNVPSANCPLAIVHVFASAADDVVPAAICTRACNNLKDFSTAAIHSSRQFNSPTITMTYLKLSRGYMGDEFI